MVGFCPIHDEKHYNKNSFSVNTIKNNWHCFSCGAGSNILDFVSLEVLEKLIDKVYLKIIRLKIGLKPDNLSKEEINNLL